MSKATPKQSTLAKRKTATPARRSSAQPAKAQPQTADAKRHAEIDRLIPLARNDEKAAAQLFKLVGEDDPGAIDRFVKGSDIAYNAQLSMIKTRGAAPDILGREMAERRLKIMRRELAGDNPSPLEKLLVHRISLCWYHLHLCECIVAQNEGSMSLAQASYHEKRLDRAHKRYLGAIKALAQVRKLQLPTIQMNVADKQLNIGTMNGTPNGNAGGAQSTLPEGRGGRLGGRLHESAAQENNR